MKVIALKPCFIDGVYRKVGDVFDVSNKLKSRSKTPPFKPVKDIAEAKAEAAAVLKAEQDRQVEAAVAASGGSAAKAKSETLAAELAG